MAGSRPKAGQEVAQWEVGLGAGALGANLEPWAGEGVPECSASSLKERGLLQYLRPGVIPHDKGKPGVP